MKEINSTKDVLLLEKWCNVNAEKTKFNYQSQVIFRIIKKNNLLKKGDYFYLDNIHRDHIEVFSKNKKSRFVLNLNMTINIQKTEQAKNRKLKIN